MQNQYKHEPGKTTELDPQRDQDLVRDYQAHTIDEAGNKKYIFTIAALMREYGISDTRIYQKMDQYGIPRRDKMVSKKNKGGKKNG